MKLLMEGHMMEIVFTLGAAILWIIVWEAKKPIQYEDVEV